jgi:hypothetical protein
MAAPRTADRPLQSARVILCEGKDEHEILSLLRRQRGLGDADVELRDAGGRDRLAQTLDDLRYESGGSGIRHVCVVLDAEECTAADMALPDHLSGVARTHGWTSRIHVLPDPQRAGGLETLARELAPGQDPAHTCADHWEACIGPQRAPKTQAQRDKAWLQVWLAGTGVYNKARLGMALSQERVVRQQMATLLARFDAILDEALQSPA